MAEPCLNHLGWLKSQTRGLAFRINALALLLTFALMILFALMGVWMEVRNEDDQIQHRLRDMQNQDIPLISSAVWEVSEERITMSLEALLRMRHVCFVEVNDGHQTKSLGSPKMGSVSFEYPLSSKEVGVFGSLMVHIDREGMKSEVWKNSKQRLIGNALPMLMLVLALMILFHHLVTRHLRQISRQLKELNLSDLSSPFKLEGYDDHRQDEINELVEGIDTMRKNLNDEIVERQFMEGEVVEREREKLEIFNAIGEAVFVHDSPSGQILDVNDQACLLFGFSKEELVGRELEFLFSGEPPYDLAHAKKNIERVIVEGELLFVWHSMKRSGEKLWVEVFLRRSELRGSACMIATIRDITERKQAQEAMAQYQKMNSIGQMAGGLAHDFNNMLGGILGATELLERFVSDDSKATKFVEMIQKSCQRAADLTSKMLSFSRRDIHRPEQHDFHHVVDEALGIVERSIDRNIEIVVEKEAPQSLVLIDFSLMQNALINLCLNARDAMPQGGKLTLRTENVSVSESECFSSSFELKAGAYIKLWVVDEGGGIAEDLVDRIFEPFFTTKEPGKGTGMGLSAVHGIIAEHGGSISVESTLGVGATFVVLLPLFHEGRDHGELSEALNPMASDEQEPVSKLQGPRGEETILVVDDEPLVLKCIVEGLELLGYQVLSASQGQEAVEIFQREHQRIDLVMLDVMMPVMNGLEAYKKMVEIRADLKTIFCSGYVDHDEVKNLLAESAVGFLPKPTPMKACASLIDNMLHPEKS